MPKTRADRLLLLLRVADNARSQANAALAPVEHELRDARERHQQLDGHLQAFQSGTAVGPTHANALAERDAFHERLRTAVRLQAQLVEDIERRAGTARAHAANATARHDAYMRLLEREQAGQARARRLSDHQRQLEQILTGASRDVGPDA